MFATVLHITIGALAFWGQELGGLHAGPVNPLNGEVRVNFRQGDFDGDGAQDLLFPDQVLFQREGSYPVHARAYLPEFGQGPRIDVWGSELYFRLPGRLVIFEWDGLVWTPSLEQRIEDHWPNTGQGDGHGGAETNRTGGNGAVFDRFLHDFNGDGVPELVWVGAEGVVIDYREGGKYVSSPILPVLPPLRLASALDEVIWPRERRRIAFPARQMACRLSMGVDSISVLERAMAPAEEAVYTATVYPLQYEGGWKLGEGAAAILETKALPVHLRPCRLNDDEQTDFAGGAWKLSNTTAVPRAFYETWATLDGGKTFHVRHAASFLNARPRCMFVDFDGDGDLDMVTESTGLLEGGLREGLSRFLTSKALDHTVAVYPQAQGQFWKKPAFRSTFHIRLQAPPVRNGPLFTRYQAGGLFDLTGDFNGDGYRDVLLQEGPERLSVYLARGLGFLSRPDARPPIPESARFNVADVNGDGKSDIVLSWVSPAGQVTGVERTRVLFAGEDLE